MPPTPVMLFATAVTLFLPDIGSADEDWPELVISFPDDSLSVRLGGQLRIDAAAYDNDIVGYDNRSRFSRARLSLEVALGRDWAS